MKFNLLPKNHTYIVVSSGHRKWVLEFLAELIQDNISNARIIYFLQSKRHFRFFYKTIYIPNYENVIFMHQALALMAFNKGRFFDRGAKIVIRYTHDSIDLKAHIDMLNNVKAIVTESSTSKLDLIKLGVNTEKIKVLPTPIDTSLFFPSFTQKRRDIIFVSSFYPRKNPNLILDVIKMNPQYTFTIFGKNWDMWENFNQLVELKNFIYLPFDYESYPETLRKHKVFCSFSILEGGPVPLLEALACNLNVVATDTGHIRDVLTSPRSYNIIPINSNAKQASAAIKAALEDESHLNFDSELYSYSNFSLHFNEILNTSS